MPFHKPLLAILALSLSACRDDERVLRVEEEVPLPSDSAQTMAIDARGRWWLGVPGGVVVRDSAGKGERIRFGGTAAPRVVGWMGERGYLRAGDTVAVAEVGMDSAVALRAGFGAGRLAIDPRGRALYQGAGSGAVLEHDPATLEPLAGWAALAAPTTAVAVAAAGDRLYQAVTSDDDGARVLVRDLQTGRIMAEIALDAPLAALAADDRGMLYAVERAGRRLTVVALRPVADRLETVWRRRVDGRAGDAEVRIVESAGRIAVAVLSPAPEAHALDAGQGLLLGRARGEPLDVSFSPDGELWALYPGVARRLR